MKFLTIPALLTLATCLQKYSPGSAHSNAVHSSHQQNQNATQGGNGTQTGGNVTDGGNGSHSHHHGYRVGHRLAVSHRNDEQQDDQQDHQQGDEQQGDQQDEDLYGDQIGQYQYDQSQFENFDKNWWSKQDLNDQQIQQMDKKQFKRAFRAIDKSKNGLITLKEMLGNQPDPDGLYKSFFDSADTDGNGKLNQDEYVNMMIEMVKEPVDQDEGNQGEEHEDEQ